MAAAIFPNRLVGVLVLAALALLMLALTVVGVRLVCRKRWTPAAICLGVAMFLFYAIFPWGVYHLPPA